MVWAWSEITASESTRLLADLPMFVAGNKLESYNVAHQWRTSGSWASGSATPYTDGVLTWSITRAWDGRLEPRTRSGALSTGRCWFMCDLANVTFDTIAIIGHNFPTALTTAVTVEIADDNAFSTRLQTIASWSSAPWLGTATRRLASVTLGAGVHVGVVVAARYSSVRYLRIRFDTTSAPEIGEIFIGQRYQMPNRPNFPLDESATDAGIDTAETDAGIQHAVRRFSGRLNIVPSWNPDSTTYENLARDAFAAARYGAKPFLYLPNPNTAPQKTYFSRTEKKLAVVPVSGSKREARFPIVEQAPFVSRET